MAGQARRPPARDTRRLRRRMIVSQITSRGLRDLRVLAAMAWTPREWFLSPDLAASAYCDGPLPIGNGQTISQPYIVALMTHHLAPRRHHRILEVGTGSGYQTAILSRLAARVFTIERLPDLLVEAEERFRRLGLTNIETHLGDGAAGWPPPTPGVFDGILVTAAAPRVPEPLVAQLAPGGRLVIPLGDLASQDLVVVERTGPSGSLVERCAGGVRFVPLISRLAFTQPAWP